MKKFLKVILDCDDVLYQCNTYALEKTNAKYGTNFTKEDIKCWGMTGTEIDNRIEFFSDPDFVKTMPLYPDAKEFVQKLSCLAEIFICTNVASNCAAERVKRIINDFPEIPESNIMIGSRKDLLHADISLDDGVHNIEKSNVNYPVLFRQPWNHTSTGFISVSTYDEFISFVKMVKESTPQIVNPNIFTFIGPSGSGKTTLMKELLETSEKFQQICSYTTRKKRENEIEGIDYHFITTEKFIEMKNNNEFFETSSYMGEYYGSTYQSISSAILKKKYPVLVLDINGAIAIKQHFSNALNIFVKRNKEDCIRSIITRNIDINDKVKRITSFDAEMKNEEFCDIILNNDDNIKKTLQPLIQCVFPKYEALKKLFEDAFSWNCETDFYEDLFEKGFSLEDIRNIMGKDVAKHTEIFMHDHGLL